MKNLEFKIARLEVDNKILRFGKDEKIHIFVVVKENRSYLIYGCPAKSEEDVIQYFDIEEKRVAGGGLFFIGKEDRLKIPCVSPKYGRLSQEYSEIVTDLIFKYLKKQNLVESRNP